MPRIDPSQLLRTLSVLLAKDGGIRSAEEVNNSPIWHIENSFLFLIQVPRIVQLMQKFSKKLVSKCIYIHILCSSNQELLESFLSQKGWDLLNMWFSDAIKNQNYFLCGDLVKLFAVCPMNPARLKENVEINQVEIFTQNCLTYFTFNFTGSKIDPPVELRHQDRGDCPTLVLAGNTHSAVCCHRWWRRPTQI